MPNEEKVCCVAICTAKRPGMLRSCLESLFAQEAPSGWRMEIILVDNEESPNTSSLAEELSRLGGMPLIYVHEPKSGIPFARNCAIEISLGRNAEWIAFIDDDEVADKNWLGTLVSAAESTMADVLQGQTNYSYPPLCRKWMLDEKRNRRRNGDHLRCATTNNVMFKAKLVHPDHWGLRFDTERAHTGGSDTAFFYMAIDKGARIVYAANAIVTANVPEERCTYKWRMKRHFRCAANSSSIEIKRKGYFLASLRLLPKLAWNLTESALLCLLLPVLILHKKSFRKYLFKAGRRFASALGILTAYLGRLPRPYETIEGS